MRDKMVARFQQELGGPHTFILSLKAGGTGLNLTYEQNNGSFVAPVVIYPH